MPKYRAGDVVRINNQDWTLGSWPDTDEGPFTASYINPANDGLVYGTFWTGMVQGPSTDPNGNVVTVKAGGAGDPVHEEAKVELVAEGEGVDSTLGDLPADEPEATDDNDTEADEPAADVKKAAKK